MIALLLTMAAAGARVDPPPAHVARICFARTHRLMGMPVPWHISLEDRKIGKLTNPVRAAP